MQSVSVNNEYCKDLVRWEDTILMSYVPQYSTHICLPVGLCWPKSYMIDIIIDFVACQVLQ